MEIGDELSALDHCPLLVVLRPRNESGYEFIGEACGITSVLGKLNTKAGRVNAGAVLIM